MAAETTRLSTEEYWARMWAKFTTRSLAFNPNKRPFRDQHALASRWLPESEDMTCLEVGCFPGRLMWYFNHYYGYQVSGLEYVARLCGPTRDMLARSGVEAEVFQEDFFSFAPADGRQWDVVASFGFIEHFSDTHDVIRRHVALVKPGGYLFISIPNHAGILGRILKAIDPKNYATHNRMTYEDMRHGVEAQGSMEVLDGGYCGHLGFWNLGLYSRLVSRSWLLWTGVRAALSLIECPARLLPDSMSISANAAIVARKTAPTAAPT